MVNTNQKTGQQVVTFIFMAGSHFPSGLPNKNECPYCKKSLTIASIDNGVVTRCTKKFCDCQIQK